MQLLLALLALSIAHMVTGYVDSSGYESFGGSKSSYRLHPERVTWDTADGVCRLEGAHLIVINSEDEAVLTNLLFGRVPPYSPPMFWGFDLLHVGMTDKAAEGQWVTVLGEPLSKSGYSKWRLGEPNNWGGENCGSIDRLGGYCDIQCNGNSGYLCSFICEKETSDDEEVFVIRNEKESNK